VSRKSDEALCARGLHPRPAEGPCPRCKGADLCRRGLHDLGDEANVYRRKNGRRACLACKRQADRDRAATKRREEEPEPAATGQPSLFRRDASAYDRHRARAGYENGLERPARPPSEARPPAVRRVRWFAGTDPAPPP
jgi:hypothetical protein